MAAGEEPDCLIDAWIKAMIEAKNANETSANGEKALLNREYSDHEIAMVLLSFLFASQGARFMFQRNGRIDCKNSQKADE